MRRFLDRVTVTGADESVNPKHLLYVAREYRFLEFGILISAKTSGGESGAAPGKLRFPGLAWQEDLAALVGTERINLSGHVCGRWAREAYRGYLTEMEDGCALWSFFGRLQLNTHGVTHAADRANLTRLVRSLNRRAKQVIFQYDLANTGTFRALAAVTALDIAALYDLSHGAGRLPDRWRRPFDGYCGYAGGLSPVNLADSLEQIESVHCGDCDTRTPDRPSYVAPWRAGWIDAETHLFSEGRFDIEKVARFAEAARPWLI